MIVKLTEAERVAIANHLAEKTTARLDLTEETTQDQMKTIFKNEFQFFKKCLDETNDY